MRRAALTLVGATLAASALFAGLAAANTPVLILPLPPVAYTAGSSATVGFIVTASDTGVDVIPTCTPESGSDFPRGKTTVTCTADDGQGNSVSGSFDVTVVGPPTLSLPSDITVTDQAANVSFDVTATDELGSLTPICSVNSPHLFPVGTTPVICTASRIDPVPGTTSGSFSVTVTDTTPPPVPKLTGPSGTITDTTPTFTFTSDGASSFVCAFDNLAPTVDCTSPHTAPSALADGSHSFSVAARNALNTSTPTTAAFTVDTTPPELSPIGPLDKAVEADGPGGTKVTFSVSASDDGVALLPSAITCQPKNGTVFPLGHSIVTCQAGDAAGNIGALTFTVSVNDTKAPSINAPNVSFAATGADGIARSDPAVSAYLSGISASDLISTPTLSTNAPFVFPIGTTTLVVTARDAAGNTASKKVSVTVLQPGVLAPPSDLTPPGRVTSLKAKAGDRNVALTWRQPLRDVARVEVRQSLVGEPGAGRLIYSGLAQAFESKRLRNGATYRFVLVAFDAAGNGSPSVVVNASPLASLLARPLRGLRVSSPPLLRWAPVPSTYFNVQLYRSGAKVLSAWTTQARLQLTARWTYKERKYLLRPGVYTWYVWPGHGARADVRYGELLGRSSFVVVGPQSL